MKKILFLLLLLMWAPTVRAGTSFDFYYKNVDTASYTGYYYYNGYGYYSGQFYYNPYGPLTQYYGPSPFNYGVTNYNLDYYSYTYRNYFYGPYGPYDPSSNYVPVLPNYHGTPYITESATLYWKPYDPYAAYYMVYPNMGIYSFTPWRPAYSGLTYPGYASKSLRLPPGPYYARQYGWIPYGYGPWYGYPYHGKTYTSEWAHHYSNMWTHRPTDSNVNRYHSRPYGYGGRRIVGGYLFPWWDDGGHSEIFYSRSLDNLDPFGKSNSKLEEYKEFIKNQPIL